MDQVRYDLDPSNWGKLSHSTGRTRMSVKRAAQGGQWKAASSTMMESGYKHNEGKEGTTSNRYALLALQAHPALSSTGAIIAARLPVVEAIGDISG
jgi:hypothetical protein